MPKTRLVNIADPKHSEILSDAILKGQVVGTIWAHHLYFLSCNALNKKAVERMNLIKNRPVNQVFGLNGHIEEVDEFVDLKRNKALLVAAQKMGLEPLKYLEFLFTKYPVMFEFYANGKAPELVTADKGQGKTIWICGHMRDPHYSAYINAIRKLRRRGIPIASAGTSFNLTGQDTFNVKQIDQILKSFDGKVDIVSVYPKAADLKRLNYSTSCSVISFIGDQPKLVRLGNTPVRTLKKVIPDLQIPRELSTTR